VSHAFSFIALVPAGHGVQLVSDSFYIPEGQGKHPFGVDIVPGGHGAHGRSASRPGGIAPS